MHKIGTVLKLDAALQPTAQRTVEANDLSGQKFRKSFEAIAAQPIMTTRSGSTAVASTREVKTTKEALTSTQPLVAPVEIVPSILGRTVAQGKIASPASGPVRKTESESDLTIKPGSVGQTNRSPAVTSPLATEVDVVPQTTAIAATVPTVPNVGNEVAEIPGAVAKLDGTNASVPVVSAKGSPGSGGIATARAKTPDALPGGQVDVAVAAPTKPEDRATTPDQGHTEQPVTVAEVAASRTEGPHSLIPMNVAAPLLGSVSADSAALVDKPVHTPTSASAAAGEGGTTSLPAHVTLIATPQVLEVGLNSSVHGWVKVRAELDGTGSVAATVISRTGGSSGTLNRDLPALSAFLTDQSVSFSSLSVRQTESAAMTPDSAGPGAQEQREGQPRQSTLAFRGAEEEAASGLSGEAYPFVAMSLPAGLENGGGGWLNVLA